MVPATPTCVANETELFGGSRLAFFCTGKEKENEELLSDLRSQRMEAFFTSAATCLCPPTMLICLLFRVSCCRLSKAEGGTVGIVIRGVHIVCFPALGTYSFTICLVVLIQERTGDVPVEGAASDAVLGPPVKHHHRTTALHRYSLLFIFPFITRPLYERLASESYLVRVAPNTERYKQSTGRMHPSFPCSRDEESSPPPSLKTICSGQSLFVMLVLIVNPDLLQSSESAVLVNFIGQRLCMTQSWRCFYLFL